ncbi:MAG: DUF4352 domain-containing protein [Kineosporiaceae bacterium]
MSYPPVPTRQLPSGQPPPAPTGPTSGLAVAGFVLAFVFAPVGLVLSLVALGRTGPGKQGGRGLAVSGAVISGLFVVVGLAVLGAAGAAQDAGEVAAVAPGAGGSAAGEDTAPDDDPPSGDPAGEAPPAPPADEPPVDDPPAGTGPGLGTPVTDGEFTFTVDSVERIGALVGNEWVNETAQGEFVLIRVTVANTGDEPRDFNAWEQDLYDTEGRLFEAQSGWFLVEGGEDSVFSTVNPGNTVVGAPLLYDVPPGAQLDRLELHDTWYSRGVGVSLR